MVIDDDRTTNALLQTLLELEGMTVVICHLATEALAQMEAEMPDVVLMDMHIGGASGLDLLTQMRVHARLRQMPVVMCSGMNVEYECKQAGAQAFVLKPYQPDDLIDVIKKAAA